MTDPIRLYVGTDPKMGVAERALRRSVARNTSRPVEIVWMRAGEAPFHDWNIGRAPGNPYPKKGGGWATDFSGFRFAVPELAGFQGRAIYLDVDMVVLGDLEELLEMPMGDKAAISAGNRPDVVVFDCAKFLGTPLLPSIVQQKSSGRGIGHFGDLRGPFWDAQAVPETWDCLDGKGLSAETRLIHYTDMHTQPWRPHPQRFDYDAKEHRSAEAVRIFWQYAGEDDR